ncbi:PSP1-domain-containing protein [Marasmius fiardii PR-910]|nr:PSP1-domain-containing protein [Marasmius fiardii PR-910]
MTQQQTQAYFGHPQQQQQHPHHQQQGHHHGQHTRQSSNSQDAGEQNLGKGLPLSSLPPTWPLFIVEFKAGRTDLFYLTDQVASNLTQAQINGHVGEKPVKVGDLVIVEADRGRDLGRVVNDSITVNEVERWLETREHQQGQFGSQWGEQPMSPGGSGGGASTKKEINPKMIYGKAGAQEITQLAIKMQDEAKALQLCQSKVRAKKLPMEVVDAEYQWDRRKLTFYFVAEKRIDFRELVRELFRLYKTRIWMASLQSSGGFEG